MNYASLEFENPKLTASQPRQLTLLFKITGAGTSAPVETNLPTLTSSAAITDAAIATFLGASSTEFTAAAFDATSMGADMFGGVVDMQGQCKKVVVMEAQCSSATDGLTTVTSNVQASTALTASTLKTEVAVGSAGNIGFKVNFGNVPDFDALTSGTIVLKIFYYPK